MTVAEQQGVLGRQVEIPTTPKNFEFDRIENPNPTRLYVCRFTVPEFTSLCPKTGQPDFANIFIDYIPRRYLVESKSLKLYMFSFRNHGAYHEAVINEIGETLVELLSPIWMRVSGIFNPRGGIPIDVWFHHGRVPSELSVHDIPLLPAPVWRGR